MNNNRRKIRKSNISLSGKISIIIISFMLGCAILWTSVMFVNIERNAKEIILKDEKAYMDTVKTNAKNVEEVCNLSTQVVSGMNAVLNYIKYVQSGEDYSPVEKIEFYNNEISAINNMTNINPYLYQVRLFVNADITEKTPCFYSIDRMKTMEWSDNYRDREWQIDYRDSVFQNSNDTARLMGVISNIKDDEGNLLAVLEVSTKIENVFLKFYNSEGNDFCCFVDENGKFYYSDSQKDVFDSQKQTILKYISKKTSDTSFITKFNGKKCVCSILPMSTIKGSYIHIKVIKDTIDSYYSSQTPYVLVVLVSVAIFIVLIFILIKNIFNRFNKLTVDVNRIQTGEKIKVDETGDDEISELGKQINNMVDSIERLNQEKVNKQLLVKNTEIKSLQNQINAHFMYNVLETIKMMAEIKGDYEISDAVTSLGQLFRYSMKWTSGLVIMNDEIEYIRNYLALLNLRFDYEIYLSLNIPPELLEIEIPKMSLQPIVENSVSHGLENLANDSSIYIKARENGGTVTIEVSDAGVGMDERTLEKLNKKIRAAEPVDDQSEHGRALYNVQQRIKMHFGPDYGLQVYSKEGLYTKVIMQIPITKERT
mgnify:CR=1 FL=1